MPASSLSKAVTWITGSSRRKNWDISGSVWSQCGVSQACLQALKHTTPKKTCSFSCGRGYPCTDSGHYFIWVANVPEELSDNRITMLLNLLHQKHILFFHASSWGVDTTWGHSQTVFVFLSSVWPPPVTLGACAASRSTAEISLLQSWLVVKTKHLGSFSRMSPVIF